MFFWEFNQLTERIGHIERYIDFLAALHQKVQLFLLKERKCEIW